jgi:hypothetical protein
LILAVVFRTCLLRQTVLGFRLELLALLLELESLDSLLLHWCSLGVKVEAVFFLTLPALLFSLMALDWSLLQPFVHFACSFFLSC